MERLLADPKTLAAALFGGSREAGEEVGQARGPVPLRMIMEIQPGDVLRDRRYEVRRLIRSAADKSAYLGHDRKFNCQVTIDAFARNKPIMPGGLTVAAWEARVRAEVMQSIDLQLEPWDGHTIAVIRILPRDEPTWVGDDLYVRCMASTEKLSTRHAVAWWRQRWMIGS